MSTTSKAAGRNDRAHDEERLSQIVPDVGRERPSDLKSPARPLPPKVATRAGRGDCGRTSAYRERRTPPAAAAATHTGAATGSAPAKSRATRRFTASRDHAVMSRATSLLPAEFRTEASLARTRDGAARRAARGRAAERDARPRQASSKAMRPARAPARRAPKGTSTTTINCTPRAPIARSAPPLARSSRWIHAAVRVAARRRRLRDGAARHAARERDAELGARAGGAHAHAAPILRRLARRRRRGKEAGSARRRRARRRRVASAPSHGSPRGAEPPAGARHVLWARA